MCRRKKTHVFWQHETETRVFCLWREPFANREELPVIGEAFPMHNRCSSDLSEERGNWEDIFSERCELTEDERVSRSVGSSRKIDYCIGVSQRFEPCDVGYPGVMQWERVCAGSCVMDTVTILS